MSLSKRWGKRQCAKGNHRFGLWMGDRFYEPNFSLIGRDGHWTCKRCERRKDGSSKNTVSIEEWLKTRPPLVTIAWTYATRG